MRYNQGNYKLINPRKYAGNPNNIVYRSGWEKKFFIWADTNPRVVKWNSEEVVIPYYHKSDKKMRRYFTDALIQYKKSDGNSINYLIEIKPHSQTIPPKRPKTSTRKTTAKYIREMLTYAKNSDKWTTAMAYAKKNDMEFILLTEHNNFVKF